MKNKILKSTVFSALLALPFMSNAALDSNCWPGTMCYTKVKIGKISLPSNNSASFTVNNEEPPCLYQSILFDVSTENGRAQKEALLMAKAAQLDVAVLFKKNAQGVCNLFSIQL